MPDHVGERESERERKSACDRECERARKAGRECVKERETEVGEAEEAARRADAGAPSLEANRKPERCGFGVWGLGGQVPEPWFRSWEVGG